MDRAMWFDTPRIESTVTKQFVRSHLLPDEVDQLDRPLAFGDGLTDCTYWEWIQGRARRLFLILLDLDVADQIFGVVDDSWEDDDLPIALDQVERLSLTAQPDPKTERKFYQRQFHYLLRPLSRGEHIDYQEHEVVPLDVHERRPGLTHNHDVDRVGLPGYPGRVFSRRRFPIGFGAGDLAPEDFMAEVGSIERLQGEHVVSYWASYTHQGYAYVLLHPACEYRLSAYLAGTPSSLKGLDKLARRRMVLDWVHCLVDTLAFLHARGVYLGNIRPSTTYFTHDNHIFLRPPPSLLIPDTATTSISTSSPSSPAQGINSFDKESYDYAAPEKRFRPTVLRIRPTGPSSSRGSAAPSVRSGRSGHTEHRSKSAAAIHRPPPTPPTPPPSSSSSSNRHEATATATATAVRSAPQYFDPQAADVFSCGCVILELLSHGLLKRSPGSFASHRGAKHKIAGRGGAVLDSSFHKNLGQVETWMAGLARDAAKKAGGGDKGKDKDKEGERKVFRALGLVLRIVGTMLSPHPDVRPSASEAQGALYQILTEVGGITELHCCGQQSHQQKQQQEEEQHDARDFGLGGSLTISPTNVSFTSGHYYNDGNHRYFAHGDGPDAGGKRTNSLRSFVGLGHRRKNSDESSRSKSSGSQSHGERWELGSGLKAIQNLRISKSWQPNLSPSEQGVASRHSR